MDVRLPDGTVIRGVPEGTTKAELTAKLKANGYDVSGFAAQEPERPKSLGQQARQLAADIGGGLVRGAASIGATLTTPVTSFDRKTGAADGRSFLEKRRDTLGQVDGALASAVGANPESMAYGGGKLVSEVAGTLGVGTPLAGLARAAGASPAVAAALQSGGFSTGRGQLAGAARAADMALRAGAGAAVGGTAAGVVNPEDAALGAVLGGALPGVVQGLGAAGRAVGRSFRSSETKAGERLAQALGGDPAAVAAQLRAAQTLVPGSQPTVAQVLRTPQAGILERVVSDSAGGDALKSRYAAQNAARLAALDRVAPVDPRGLRSAQVDLGEDLTRRMVPIREAENKRVSDLFEAVDPDELVRMRLPLDQMREKIDRFLGDGTVKQGANARAVVAEAERIGTQTLEGLQPLKAGPKPRSLAQEIRGLGGISLRNDSGVAGEIQALSKDLKNLTRRQGGESPAKLAEKLYERGLLPDEDVNTLLNALRAEASGDASYTMGNDLYRQYASRAEQAMGDLPVDEVIPRAVTWREAQNLRSSINDLWSEASTKGKKREAAALQKMIDALDNATEDVASGKLQPDEFFPDGAAAKWRQALDEFSSFRGRFDTGPQSAMFRRGADGRPIASGGKVAPRFWGTGAAAADNVRSFRRLVADNPELLGQFKAMVTTEGAGTADASGALGVKFVRWVENALPGLKAGFQPQEVRQLQRLAADAKRASMAASAGMARGSNTYQNASNALSLGLLDSPLLNAAANRVPIANTVSGPALQWMRESARARMAEQLANVMLDPATAAEALFRANRPAAPMSPLIPLGVRALPPALAGDQ